jgi:hypothetical protein
MTTHRVTTVTRRSGAGMVASVLAGAALGMLAAVTTGRGITYLLALGLVAPLFVALREIRKNLLGGSALLIFALGLLLFFGSRLFIASPTRGLLAYAPMSDLEFGRAQRLGNLLLSLFGVAAAAGMVATRRAPPRARTGSIDSSAAPTRKWELALCIGLTAVGVIGALLSATPSLAPGLEVGASAPGQLLWQLTTPVPALLVLRRRRLIALLLAMPICLVPVVGGRRQALLTPLIFLLLAWLATTFRARSRIRIRHLFKTGLVLALLFVVISTL